MRPAVEVENLQYSYADGTPALQGVSMRIDSGECVGLIGPNGAGKSTLLLHLNGLLPEDGPAPGLVRIFGEPIGPSTVLMARQKVGLVFQDANDQIFCSTVYEDVAFGPEQLGLTRDAIDQRVRDSLARVGLSGFESRAPHHLSGGEKRRLCLAGVLACEPQILVLDEPTADLDPRGKRDLKRLLAGIPITKIIATHDLELVAELCDRVIVIDEGKVIAQGGTLELLSDEALMLRHGLERPHILKHLHPHA